MEKKKLHEIPLILSKLTLDFLEILLEFLHSFQKD